MSDYHAMRGRARSNEMARVVAILVICAALANCSDSSQTGLGGREDVLVRQIRAAVQMSGPLSARSTASASGAARDSELVYVSTSPHTLNFGDSVVLKLASGGEPAVGAKMIDGGFDPIAILARPNDLLDVTVIAGGAATTARLRVPGLRQPTVVRAIPARGRTDVPLNQAIEIVFSQPLDAASATPSTIQLLVGGSPVPVTVTVSAEQPWIVVISPTVQLDPNTSYEIAVSTLVTDVVGSPVAAAVNSNFTTGASAGAVSSVLVLTGGEYVSSLTPITTRIVATPGATVPFFADRFDIQGNLLASGIGSSTVWSSSDASVAAIDSTGMSRGIAAGQATISACVGSVFGRRTLTVADPGAGVQPRDLGPALLNQMTGAFMTGSVYTPPDQTGLQQRHATLWTDARGLEDLGSFEGATDTYGELVNDSGTVLGGANYDGYWLWTRESGMRALDLQGRSTLYWFPIHISANNVITFALPFLNNISSLGLWSAESGFRTVTLDVQAALAFDANNVGQVLLSTDGGPDGQGPCGTNAYIWDSRSNRITSTLAPKDSATNQPLGICPYQINDRGTVVGFVYGQTERAFRWNASTGFEYLQPLDANDITSANAVNQAGDVVAFVRGTHYQSGDSSFSYTAFVWDANNKLTILAPLGGDRASPIDINDNHRVFGYGNLGSSVGEQRSLIWDYGSVTPSRVATVTRTVSDRLAGGTVMSRSVFTPLRVRARLPFRNN